MLRGASGAGGGARRNPEVTKVMRLWRVCPWPGLVRQVKRSADGHVGQLFTLSRCAPVTCSDECKDLPVFEMSVHFALCPPGGENVFNSPTAVLRPYVTKNSPAVRGGLSYRFQTKYFKTQPSRRAWNSFVVEMCFLFRFVLFCASPCPAPHPA